MDYRKEEINLQETMQRPYLNKCGLLTLKGYDKLLKDFFVIPFPLYVQCRSRSISRPNFEFALAQLDDDVKKLFYKSKIQGLRPLRFILDDPLCPKNVNDLVDKTHKDITAKFDMIQRGELFTCISISKERDGFHFAKMVEIDPKDVLHVKKV